MIFAIGLEQRDWSKFKRFWDKLSKEKFNKEDFKPFDKVIVRDFINDGKTNMKQFIEVHYGESYNKYLCNINNIMIVNKTEHNYTQIKSNITFSSSGTISRFLSFPTIELVKEFMNNFKDLIEQVGDLI